MGDDGPHWQSASPHRQAKAPATDPLAPSASQCPVASSPSVGLRLDSALPARQPRPQRTRMHGSFWRRHSSGIGFAAFTFPS
jgi:hypothetical protein